MTKEMECFVCSSRIREHYSMLSNQEKRVADALLSQHVSYRSMTAASLAEMADVSGPTVVRFCRSIGFKGFTEFKMYVLNQLNRPEATWESVEVGDTADSISSKVFVYNRSAMDDTVQMLNAEEIQCAVDMILKAKRIFIFAGGGASATALAMSDAFLQIGILCIVVQDSLFQVMNAQMLTADDLAIGISHSGRTKIVIDALSIAKKAGAPTLAIVGLVGSPVSKYADVQLYTGLVEHSYFSKTLTSRLCELQVVSTLYSMIYLRCHDKITAYQEHLNDAVQLMFQNK